MMQRNSMRFTAVTTVLAALLYFPAHALAVDEASIPTEGVTQGEFAMWLVEAAGAEGKLPPAALAQDAIQLLSDLGIKPKDGWDADKKLTQKDLADMLGLSEKEAQGKSWADLVQELVQNVTDTIAQISATSQAGVSPSVSPGGGR